MSNLAELSNSNFLTHYTALGKSAQNDIFIEKCQKLPNNKL